MVHGDGDDSADGNIDITIDGPVVEGTTGSSV